MGYWITSLGLIAFGFVEMFSIGRPFFLVGLAMLVLGPVRFLVRLEDGARIRLLGDISSGMLTTRQHYPASR